MTIVVVSGTPTEPQSLSPKPPANGIFVYFEFADWCAAGVTVVSAVTLAEDSGGNDVSSAIISGAATMIGPTRAKQFIIGGTLGQVYQLNCEATFSDGQTETLSIDLPIGYLFGVPE